MLILCFGGIFDYIILPMLHVPKLIHVDAKSVNASGPQNNVKGQISVKKWWADDRL